MSNPCHEPCLPPHRSLWKAYELETMIRRITLAKHHFHNILDWRILSNHYVLRPWTSNPATNMVYILATKVLHTLLFTAIKWSSYGIQLTKVFHLTCRILEEKTPGSFMTVAQITVDLPTTEDIEVPCNGGHYVF